MISPFRNGQAINPFSTEDVSGSRLFDAKFLGIMALVPADEAGRLEGTLAKGLENEIKGGVYLLRDKISGSVMRTGRTNNLLRRELEHARNSDLEEFRFETIYKTNNYDQQRGLEQMLHDQFIPPLNRINPISPTNLNREDYLNAAHDFLNGGGP